MLTWDETYIKAKQIIEGEGELNSEFQFLKYFLAKEFKVSLINADVYYQPVFKSILPSLRLIIDFTTDKSKLPIRYEEKKLLIADAFIKFSQENQIEEFAHLRSGELNVSYIDINYLKFEEASRNISSEIKKFDSKIENLIINHHTYYIFYSNEAEVKQNKELKQDQKILEQIVGIIKDRGYQGEYLNRINVILDENASVNRAGGVYNYMR